MYESIPFKPDRKLTDVLNQECFTFSAEIIPPRNGSDQQKILSQINTLVQSGVHFLAVTKGAGGSLRGGSLPIAQVIKERFSKPCIAHFTCRDLTPVEVENHLMDHHYFGIRNILALRGDPPDGQKEWTPREGGYRYAYQLIEQIQALNHGLYLTRANGPKVDFFERTDFCIGAAAYPEHPDEKERITFFKLKISAGAQYGITDMLFNPETYARFLDLCLKNGVEVPILPGTRILKTQAQAKRMMSKFRVEIPSQILDLLPAEETPHNKAEIFSRGLDYFLKMTERLRQLGAPGIHLYVLNDTESASSALRRLAM